jgi:hypothetical protein
MNTRSCQGTTHYLNIYAPSLIDGGGAELWLRCKNQKDANLQEQSEADGDQAL